MSLSKLYKSNSAFKPSLLLDKTANSAEPVWESIVKIEPEAPVTLTQENELVEQLIDEKIDSTDELKEKLSQVQPNNPSTTEPPLSAPVSPTIEPVQEPVFDLDVIREESFNSGLLMGRKQAEEDFNNGAQTFINICNELDQLRETILKNSVNEMRELVLAIAEKIIRKSVHEQCETITATIKEAIHLAVKSDEFQIQLNPDDLSSIEEKKSEIIAQIRGLKNIVLLPDSTIERGGCLIESSSCTIDASIASQIGVIHNSVMQSSPLNTAKPDNSTQTVTHEP